MNRRTKICMWVILLGLANFLLYVVGYAVLSGESVHGHIAVRDGVRTYYLQSGRRVSHAEFLYSGVHSISIWPTVAAVMLAMLTMAKDRIAASMRMIVSRERLLVTLCAVVIGLMSAVFTYDFVHTFHHHFRDARRQTAAHRLREAPAPPAAAGAGGPASAPLSRPGGSGGG